MTVPTVSWSETTPAGSDNASQGDDRIREFKTQVREVIDVDHDFPSSGQAADVGQHKQVTLQEQADIGTGAVGATILGSQTVSGKGELVYTDEDDNDVQITSGGKLKAESVDGVYPCSTVAKAINILQHAYPVGSIYINATDNTNPATLLGFGTWSAFGAGKVMVGYDAGDTDFDSAEETGGAKTHTLLEAELPSHTHSITITSCNSNSGAGDDNSVIEGQQANENSTVTATSGATGSGTAFSVVQPYITVYMWKRTA